MDYPFRVACMAGGYVMNQLTPSEGDAAQARKERTLQSIGKIHWVHVQNRASAALLKTAPFFPLFEPISQTQ